MSIWRKKPLAAYEADMKKSELNRVLGKWGLTSLGIGAIIGGGIFTLTGIAAHDHAGPALAISFIIAGIGCTFAALCYAEFSSVLPVEGSAYAYSYGTVGEMFAWFIGWNLILEYMMGATTVAVSWSGYFIKLMGLFGIKFPMFLTMDYSSAKAEIATATNVSTLQDLLAKFPTFAELKANLTNGPVFDMIKEAKNIETVREIAGGANLADLSAHYSSIDLPGFAFNLPAFIITWIVTMILVKGIKEAASTNNLIVIVKVAVVLFVIVAGTFFIKSSNWSPFIPKHFIDSAGHGHFGWGGVITAATIVFFAYIGFDAVSTQAGEAINPKKDVPFAIIASLILCTILYIAVSLILTGMVRYDQLDLRAPVASAFSAVGLTWAVYIITIAAVAGLTSVMLVMMLGQTRIFLGMAKDGLLPRKMFASIHPKFKTPYRSTILVGAIISIVASLTPINTVSEMCSMGTLLAFAMISGAVWLLRVREPNLERPYRTPALPVVATLGMGFNLFLMTQVRANTWIAFLVWGTTGVIVYFLYSRKHSNLHPGVK
jgi:APA family basic amino acid/polyamine antiporter